MSCVTLGLLLTMDTCNFAASCSNDSGGLNKVDLNISDIASGADWSAPAFKGA